ncbi:hypothetical protein [Flavihumibacter cheonanensis]|uniref:hypothetical protein n=1 Tax=Flavihumibacter cheonanensis TaxID=1442385 RepID=UPI001EF82278|nr:hypothetical protein [Flavihumibacter cheonanensis]MCG7754295.1 hypothetical protein [Flavihumibacter cheonanensis]
MLPVFLAPSSISPSSLTPSSILPFLPLPFLLSSLPPLPCLSLQDVKAGKAEYPAVIEGGIGAVFPGDG